MNAGIVFEDEDVPMAAQPEEVKKVHRQLREVKLSLTRKKTLTAEAEYGILRRKLRTLTGSLAW